MLKTGGSSRNSALTRRRQCLSNQWAWASGCNYSIFICFCSHQNYYVKISSKLINYVIGRLIKSGYLYLYRWFRLSNKFTNTSKPFRLYSLYFWTGWHKCATSLWTRVMCNEFSPRKWKQDKESSVKWIFSV